MSSQENMLLFMDLLDLNEEVIDSRLKTIMLRNTFTNKHLENAIHLLKYKYLINVQEGTDCENSDEIEFVIKLINDLQEENINNVCKITNIVLSLNITTLVVQSEHLLQQMLSNIDFSAICNKVITDDVEDGKLVKTLLILKLCESILDAVIGNSAKLQLHFLDVPLETIVESADDKLNVHFLTNTVPKFFEGVIGFNILDRIWTHIKQIKNNVISLKVLGCLSEFYLPIADNGTVKYESEIIHHYELWEIILYGLSSNDPSVRKISVYLAKRAIDFFINLKIDMIDNTLFKWEHKYEKKYKNLWDNYFILMDSLEEKQSNIVLPSLQLFKILNEIGMCWLNCAFNIGLKHDNTQVRLKCIEHRLRMRIHSELEAVTLLEALNDTNLYDEPAQCELLKINLFNSLKGTLNFNHIFTALAKVKWSPVPLYYVSDVISRLHFKEWALDLEVMDALQTCINILKIPCNIIPIRRAIHINMLYLIMYCCKRISWKEYIIIFSNFQLNYFSVQTIEFVTKWITNNLNLNDQEKHEFLTLITSSRYNLDFALLYLGNHEEDMWKFKMVINEVMCNVSDIIKRQYSNKKDCLQQVTFLISLLNKIENSNSQFGMHMLKTVDVEYKLILHYILYLLSDTTILNINELDSLFHELDIKTLNLKDDDTKQILLQLYKTSVLFLKDINTSLEKTVFTIYCLNNIVGNSFLVGSIHNEILNLTEILEMIMSKIEDVSNRQSKGRLRNVVYEKSSEIVYYTIENLGIGTQNLNFIVDFIEKVVECGGYGCLRWILKIINKIIDCLIEDKTVKFDIIKFIDRAWKEIEELKSNNQYPLCMEEFVNLITHNAVISNKSLNNIVTLYCSKIIDYGQMRNTPLYLLVKKLSHKDLYTELGHIVYVLTEILLFSPVPKKDQRIIDNIVVTIQHDPKFRTHKQDLDMYFNYQIQYLSVLTLCKLNNSDTYALITSLILNKIDKVFINKMRYHGNSQLHRTLLAAVQNLLIILLLDKSKMDIEKTVNWCIEILVKLPHQPSVRVCLEWYIALYCILNDTNLNEENLLLNNLPLTSQFMIFYWVIKHKILNNVCNQKEYQFVMDTLLCHTMRQMFNIRLYAQYLAMKLYKLKIEDEASKKYTYIMEVIEKTFVESYTDKNLIKLQEDYFINHFKLLDCWTPCFIFYFLPRYHGVAVNETIDIDYLKSVLLEIDKYTFDEVDSLRVRNDELLAFNFNNDSENKGCENAEAIGTIQKKYVPWNTMTDIEVYSNGKKKESKSELIVVASLIDKLPNLGGMARTSEVFGVKTYIVNSLRHIQDRQFQGLSVSAERWVNIEEIRPGPALKQYLIEMKAEGYSVVAAEQTSNSCALQKFKFPKKTLLLLGHEKEGVPCDLLPIMDFCVEIPQQGFVRSLNVHVTASIFIWEYTRQNIL